MCRFKFFLFLFTLLLISETAQAQIALGPKIGINLATLGGSDVEGFDEISSIVGSQFGLTAQIDINEQFSIQPELLYFQKGLKTEFEFFGEKIVTEQNLNYLEIPILAKFMFGGADGPQFFATAGPSFGFGLGGKTKSEGEEEDIDFDDDEITKLDIGVSVGAGAQFAAGSGNLFIDVRYLLGLNTLDSTEENTDIKNRGIGIAAGFLFPIGGE